MELSSNDFPDTVRQDRCSRYYGTKAATVSALLILNLLHELEGMHLKNHFEPRRHRVTEFLIGFLGVSVPQWLGFWTFARGQLTHYQI